MGEGVLGKTRAFTIMQPWLSILAVGHIPEVFRATLADKIGLRQRLTVSFPRPTWKTIAEIRNACALLPVPSHTPDDYVAALLFPVLRNSLSRQPIVYTADLGDGASKVVDDKFDSHMALQRENFLVPFQQEVSKKHGKLRTKFDRLVIAVHLLNTYCEYFESASFDLAGSSFSFAFPHSKNMCGFSVRTCAGGPNLELRGTFDGRLVFGLVQSKLDCP